MATTLDLPVNVGGKIKNGAVVLAIKPSDGNRNEWIGLCLFNDEFVTWVLAQDEDGAVLAHWGDYFRSLDHALASFHERG